MAIIPGVGASSMHGALVPIATYTVSGTSTYTVTLSSIPQKYQDLMLVTSVRTAYSNLSETIGMYLNGDNSSGLYSFTNIVTADTIYNGRSTGVNQWTIAQVIGNTSATGMFGSSISHILNYTNTSTYKSAVCRHAADLNNSGNGCVGMYGCLYRSTNAVTSLSLQSANGAYFIAGSTFNLYGVRSVGQ